MPRDSDDIEQGRSPITPPEGDVMEQELPEPIPVAAPASKWSWIGSPDRPEAQRVSDGISDLFEVDMDDDTTDLISVDLENDIMDGDLSDLTEVSEEDIMGDEETGQIPLDYRPDPPRRIMLPRYRRTPVRIPPITSMGGLSG